MKGLVARLLLLVSMALLPVLGFEIHSEYEARQVRQQLMEDEALRLVRLVASEQQRIVDGTEQVLDTLASTPAVRDNRPELCQPLVTDLVQKQPRYINAFVAGVDGHLVCTPEAPDPSITLSDRDYFQAAMSSGVFAVGTYTVGRYIKRPAIALAKPFTNRDGVIVGVVGVSLNLSWLQQQLERLPVPPAASAWIADRNGTILARVPAAPGFIGAPIAAANRFTLEGNQARVVEASGRNGRTFVVGYLPLGAEPTGLAIGVGLDRETTFAAVTQANRTGVVLIVASGLLALLITVLAGGRLIRRPVQQLLAAADRWRGGDLAARSGVREDSSEFGRLGTAFDAMAAALATREQALRSALESTTDGVVAFDRCWRLTYLNARAKAQIAQGRDLLGQVAWEAFPALAGTAFGDAYKAAMEQGRPTHVESYYAPLGSTFETHIYPSENGVTVFYRDLSEQRRVEGELRQATALLRAIGNCSPDSIYAKDAEGRFLFTNPAVLAIIGKPANEVIGHTDLEWHTDPEQAAAVMANDRRIIETERVEIVEEIFDAAGVGRRVFRSAKAPLRMEGGQVLGVAAVSSDITVLKETEANLRRLTTDLETRVAEEVAAREAAQARAAQAERMQALGQLAGGIAHDFNNVLQMVEGAGALIERRPRDATSVRRLARVVLEAAGRGASITRRLLAFGRRGDLRAETLDVVTLMAGMQEILAHTLGAAIEVDVRLADDVPPILADKGQLETALVNLAANARDAMPNGGRLVLAAEPEIVPSGGPRHPFGLAPGRYVRLTIADTGRGMAADTLAHAMEPFFTTKGVGAGTGLGLAMVRGFAEQSGGALNISSTPGSGTTVTLCLPAADVAARPGSTAPQTTDAPPANASGDAASAIRLLLVDDEVLLREVLGEQLEEAGYSVLSAANGEEALALLEAGEAVDVLVTDLSMPGIDGLAVIRAAQERHPGLPAVLLTGYAGEDVTLAVSGTVAGAFSLLRKPIRLHDLIDRIQSLFAARANVDQRVR